MKWSNGQNRRQAPPCRGMWYGRVAATQPKPNTIPRKNTQLNENNKWQSGHVATNEDLVYRIPRVMNSIPYVECVLNRHLWYHGDSLTEDCDNGDKALEEVLWIGCYMRNVTLIKAYDIIVQLIVITHLVTVSDSKYQLFFINPRCTTRTVQLRFKVFQIPNKI